MIVNYIPKKKAKPNYELKAKVIENGCCALMRKFSLTNWKLTQEEKNFLDNGEIGKFNKLLSIRDNIENRMISYSEEELKESVKVNTASYRRTTRLRCKVNNMLKLNECIFLTLTFTNDVLENTTSETRKKYVERFLKDTCIKYIANIDYGLKNEREHYHAVVIAKDNKVDGSLYSYGAINFERVHRHVGEEDDINTSKRLAKYVNKLTNHAIKNTVRQNRIIYSREKKKTDIEILQDIFGINIKIID